MTYAPEYFGGTVPVNASAPILLYVGERYILNVATPNLQAIDIVLAWSHIGRYISIAELAQASITKNISSITFNIPAIPVAKVRNLNFSIRRTTNNQVIQSHIWSVRETSLPS